MILKVTTSNMGTYTGSCINFTEAPPVITLRTEAGDQLIMCKDIVKVEVISTKKIVTADGIEPVYIENITIK